MKAAEALAQVLNETIGPSAPFTAGEATDMIEELASLGFQIVQAPVENPASNEVNDAVARGEQVLGVTI